MSVLIKGMKMPSACISCDFCNPFTDEPYCRLLMRKTPKVTRLKDCPLVEVSTPHGRLIDASEYEARMGEVYEEYCYDVLDMMPTIIEAEEG